MPQSDLARVRYGLAIRGPRKAEWRGYRTVKPPQQPTTFLDEQGIKITSTHLITPGQSFKLRNLGYVVVRREFTNPLAALTKTGPATYKLMVSTKSNPNMRCVFATEDDEFLKKIQDATNRAAHAVGATREKQIEPKGTLPELTSGHELGYIFSMTELQPSEKLEPLAVTAELVRNGPGEQPAQPTSGTAITVAEPRAGERAEDDAKLRQGFVELGGRPEAFNAAIALRGFAGAERVKSILGMTMAGLAVNADRLMKAVGNLERRIEAGKFSVNEKGDPAEESMVLKEFGNLIEQHRKTADQAQRSLLIMAKIQALDKSSEPAQRHVKLGSKPKGEMMVNNIVANNVTVRT